jgi:hypothetical protein
MGDLGFAGVVLEVVELAWGIGGGFGEDVGGEWGVGEVAVAAGAGVVEVFPMAAADGEVEVQVWWGGWRWIVIELDLSV